MHSVSTMTQAAALLCLTALLWTAGVPAQEAENPNVIAVSLTAPAVYVAEQELELTVRVTAADPDGIFALGVSVAIPDGWTYVRAGETVSGLSPTLKPQAGASGDLGFAWIAAPEELAAAFPQEFRFTVLAAADAAGLVTFSALALYRLTGDEMRSDVFTLAVPDEDTVPPVIALLGGDIVAIEAGKPYVEPGYVALDDVDGDITDFVVVDGAVNTAITGDYILTYTVADSAGNQAVPVTRLVQVVPACVTAKGFFLCGAAAGGPTGGSALVFCLTVVAVAARRRHVRGPYGTIGERRAAPQAWKDDEK